MLKNNTIKLFILFVLLVLLQVMVLNRISFLGYAVPFLYIYFIVKLPIGMNRSLVIFLGFLLGFIVDIFCNTPGMNAAATTLAAFVRKPIQKLFFSVDDYNEQTPRFSLLGGTFVKYAVTITFVHTIALVSIESFSYFNIVSILLRIGLSTLVTSLLIFALEGFSVKKDKSWQKTT